MSPSTITKTIPSMVGEGQVFSNLVWSVILINLKTTNKFNNHKKKKKLKQKQYPLQS